MNPGHRHTARTIAAAVAGTAGAAWLAAHATAPAVRAWSPGGGIHTRVGRLTVRVADRPPELPSRVATVLLHGLMASGDTYGASYDALADDGPLLVPDLLGFGRSMDTSVAVAGAFDLHAHVAALGTTIAGLVPEGMPVRIGGHSMGGVLALHLAGQLIAQGRPVARVVTWGAPLYRDRAVGLDRIATLSAMSRLFARDTPLAEVVCAAMCRFRRTAAVLAVAMSPRLPVPIARRGVLHTWGSYRQAFDTIVLDATWPDALRTLGAADVATRLVGGTSDPVIDPATLASAAHLSPTVETQLLSDATHELPLTHARACRASLQA
ncbi:alpha/beta fold hydrolase [soil metagenome]